MIGPDKAPVVGIDVVRNPHIMSGDPVVRGTRVPAMTIVAYLRANRRSDEILADYPTLREGGIEAVIAWASIALGPDWRSGSPERLGSDF